MRPFQAVFGSGEVAERLNAPHSKCGIRATVSGVRIPPSPPVSLNAKSLKNRGSGLPEQAAGWPVTSNHPTVVGRGPRSGDESAAIEIDDRSRGKADGHEGEDLPRDIFTHTDAANGQSGCRLGEHVAARGLPPCWAGGGWGGFPGSGGAIL